MSDEKSREILDEKFVTPRSGELSYVINSKGEKEDYQIGKIQEKIQRLIDIVPKLPNIHAATVARGISGDLVDGIHTREIDFLSAQMCGAKALELPEYQDLAARVLIDMIFKYTPATILETAEIAMSNVNEDTGAPDPMLHPAVYNFIKEHHVWIESIVDHSRDYLLSAFGIFTLRRTYLMRVKDVVIEKIQYLRIREAIGIHVMASIHPTYAATYTIEELKERIKETYDTTTLLLATHATPTLQNAGSVYNQLISCNLGTIGDDTDSITHDTSYSAATLSKHGAGVAISWDMIRAAGSTISGTAAKGKSASIVKSLRVYKSIFDMYDQGGGKRAGSMASYMSIHNVNIFDWLKAMDIHAPKDYAVPDIFYGLANHELFEQRVAEDGVWSLFNPITPGVKELTLSWGDEYIARYLELEEKGAYKMQVSAQELKEKICHSRLTSGMPYVCNIDAFNRKSNQQNIGPIYMSNLCTEIALPTKPGEWQNCVIASICFGNFIFDSHSDEEKKHYAECEANGKPFVPRELDHNFPTHPVVDYQKLSEVSAIINRNLDIIVDINHYPTGDNARGPNLSTRPVGAGAQGEADAIHKCKLVQGSDEAVELSSNLHEAMYYGALHMSMTRARKYGKYPMYEGSPISYGYLQPDMWAIEKLIKVGIDDKLRAKLEARLAAGKIPEGKLVFPPNNKLPDWPISKLVAAGYKPIMDAVKHKSKLFNWPMLRKQIAKYGVRNSEVTADMPTASTSQIMGSTEGTEAVTYNLYARDTKSGYYMCLNRYLIKEIRNLGLFSPLFGIYLLKNRGSVANMKDLPEHIRERFKTAWEIKKSALIKQASAHGRFISQAESRNVYIPPEIASPSALASYDQLATKSGIKTISYYVRSKVADMPDIPIMPAQEENIEAYLQKIHERIKDIGSNFVPNMLPGATTVDKICLSCSG